MSKAYLRNEIKSIFDMSQKKLIQLTCKLIQTSMQFTDCQYVTHRKNNISGQRTRDNTFWSILTASNFS